MGLVLVAAALAPGRAAAFDYDRQVLFATSPGDRSYYHSEASAVAPSRLEAVSGKLPVERDRCASAPNCLRLRWRSRPGGTWQATLAAEKHWGSRSPVGDTLSLWSRSEEGLSVEASPQIQLFDAAGQASAAIRLFGSSLPAGQWVQIQLPLDSFAGIVNGTGDRSFDPRRIAKVVIAQGFEDGAAHTLLLDEVAIADAPASGGEPPAAPSNLAAEGYDRHVDLTWGPPDAEVRHFTIYRSTDGRTYRPIGVQNGGLTRYVDFPGRRGVAVHYKVSAVDPSFRESRLSEPVQAGTRSLSDDELLTMVQRACFRYYWEAAHPVAGMALEVIPGDPDLVAVGASGFGIMAMIVAAERGFVTREQAADRMVQIVRFLARADRFHGVFPHFLDGRSGKTIARFGRYDDGGDLVETAFLMQGLLAARQYYGRDTAAEREIRATITRLWRAVEWDWHAKGPDRKFLYWHWSPKHAFHIRHPLVGWNETMIAYILAIASPTHPVPAKMYHTGWAGQSDLAVRYRQGWGRTTDGDHYLNGKRYFGVVLDVGVGNGAELFFTQFSFMGFDPRGLRDRYTNYFHNNRAIALIHRAYSIANPRRRVGYGASAWGFSAGIHGGGGRPQPRDDNGTIAIHAALGAFPYTPEHSMRALKHYYRDLGPKVWGIYGFHDGFNRTDEWYEPVSMGLDQAPIVVMIENHRSGLVWKHFMANPEIAPALEAIGFRKD